MPVGLDLPVKKVFEVHPVSQVQPVLHVYRFNRSIDELRDKLDVQVRVAVHELRKYSFQRNVESSRGICCFAAEMS